MEAAGDGRCGDARLHVVEKRLEGGRRVEEQDRRVLGGRLRRRGVLRDGDRVTAVDARLVGRTTVRRCGRPHGSLQKNRRLAFVGRVLAYPQDGARRVEKTADRRGHRRVQAALDHLVAKVGLLAKRIEYPLRRRVLEQVELPQNAVRHAQGILHAGGTARHGNVGEVREPLIGLRVRKQHFPAPDGTVRTEPRSVEGDSAHRARKTVLAYDRSDVRMVMLHLDQRDIELSRLLACPFRSEILGVRVAGKARCAQLEKLLEAAFRVKPGIESFSVFQIAHMLGDERLRAANKSEGTFLLRARRKEHRGDRSSFVACGFGRSLMASGASRLGGRGILRGCGSLWVGARLRQLQRHGREPARTADHLHGSARRTR